MAAFTGKVVRRAFAAGSKSERMAVILETPEGDYVLRREGGNAFSDPVLEHLVGKRIVAEGTLHDYTLIISEFQDV